MTDPAKYQGIQGALYLTNKKIVFDYEERGIFFIGQHSALSLPLESISSSSVVGLGPFKRLVIITATDFDSFGTPRHEFVMDNPEEWKERIELAKRKSPFNLYNTTCNKTSGFYTVAIELCSKSAQFGKGSRMVI